MHPQTGAIATFETDTDAKEAGYTVKLNPEQFKRFQGMNRQQRRAEAAQDRKRRRAQK